MWISDSYSLGQLKLLWRVDTLVVTTTGHLPLTVTPMSLCPFTKSSEAFSLLYNWSCCRAGGARSDSMKTFLLVPGVMGVLGLSKCWDLSWVGLSTGNCSEKKVDWTITPEGLPNNWELLRELGQLPRAEEPWSYNESLSERSLLGQLPRAEEPWSYNNWELLRERPTTILKSCYPEPRNCCKNAWRMQEP